MIKVIVMYKKILKGIALSALLQGGTQAMETLGFDSDEAFNAWIYQEASRLEKEAQEHDARLMAEELASIELACQKAKTLEEEKALRKQKENETLRKESRRELINYICQQSSTFNADGLHTTTNENQNQIHPLVDKLKSELNHYTLDDLRHFYRQPKFIDLNGIIKGVVERTIIDKAGLVIENKNDNLLPFARKYDGTISPHQCLETLDHSNKYLKLTQNLFYTLGEDVYFNYAYGPRIFERQNSSGANNCCLLFSIIGNDTKLYAKVMTGIKNEQDAHNYLENNPELSNVSSDECSNRGINRRNFKHVREKFFGDIIDNLDMLVTAQDNKTTTIRDFLDNNLKGSDLLRNKYIETDSFKQTLNWIHTNDIVLDSFFATIFSWIYNEKVIVLNGIDGYPILENANLNHLDLMPNITEKDVPNLIYVYIGGYGGHYQKLKIIA